MQQRSTSSSSASPGGTGKANRGGSRSTSAASSDTSSYEGADVSNAANRLKETAGDAFSQVKDQAASAVRTQRDRAAETLHSLSDALRKANENAEDDNSPMNKLMGAAASKIDSISEYVRDHELSDYASEFAEWARRNPAVFLTGSFIAGALIARFVKSSRDRGFDGNDSGSSSAGYGARSGSISRAGGAPFGGAGVGRSGGLAGGMAGGATGGMGGAAGIGGRMGTGQSGASVEAWKDTP